MTDTLYSRNDQREYSGDLFQLYYLIYIPGVQGIFQTSGSSKLRLRPIPVTIEKVSSGIEFEKYLDQIISFSFNCRVLIPFISVKSKNKTF